MKLFILLFAISVLMASASDCSSKAKATVSYRGRLEIKGICSNYTIKLTEGTIDTSEMVAAWTDDVTNKSYTNVFGVSNPCDFPKNIEPGDEFYFTMDSSAKKTCMVCMAYYPTPPKKLSIRVIEK